MACHWHNPRAFKMNKGKQWAKVGKATAQGLAAIGVCAECEIMGILGQRENVKIVLKRI